MSNQKLKGKKSSKRTYAEKALHRKAFQKEVNRQAALVAQTLSEDNPDYADFSIKPANIAYAKGQKGIGRVYFKIADVMMQPNNISRTQKSILEEVQLLFPDLVLQPNIWNRPLFPKVRKQLCERVNGNLKKTIDLRKCKTLANIKKKVRAAQQTEEDSFAFKAKIVFTADAVVIGKTSYPLIMREAKNNHYPCIRVNLNKGQRRCWVRMDGLVAALKNA